MITYLHEARDHMNLVAIEADAVSREGLLACWRVLIRMHSKVSANDSPVIHQAAVVHILVAVTHSSRKNCAEHHLALCRPHEE